jgi:hypothetical protein
MVPEPDEGCHCLAPMTLGPNYLAPLIFEPGGGVRQTLYTIMLILRCPTHEGGSSILSNLL